MFQGIPGATACNFLCWRALSPQNPSIFPFKLHKRRGKLVSTFLLLKPLLIVFKNHPSAAPPSPRKWTIARGASRFIGPPAQPFSFGLQIQDRGILTVWLFLDQRTVKMLDLISTATTATESLRLGCNHKQFVRSYIIHSCINELLVFSISPQYLCCFDVSLTSAGGAVAIGADIETAMRCFPSRPVDSIRKHAFVHVASLSRTSGCLAISSSFSLLESPVITSDMSEHELYNAWLQQ
jgi:hypothetical protein